LHWKKGKKKQTQKATVWFHLHSIHKMTNL
jgi:hypothetical protein